MESNVNWKLMLSMLTSMEEILENVLKVDNGKDINTKAQTLLDSVKEGKSWVINNYPPEQYLIDNPFNK